jgi:hypothetical protein
MGGNNALCDRMHRRAPGSSQAHVAVGDWGERDFTILISASQRCLRRKIIQKFYR